MQLFVQDFVDPGSPPLAAASLPACDSCSRKLDQSSASDSLLLAPLSMNSVAKVGVLGERRGLLGTRSLLEAFEVPGRARPACSRCSVDDS